MANENIYLPNSRVTLYGKQRLGKEISSMGADGFENRVNDLERSMTSFDSEIKMINRTMVDIATTLKEIKDDQKRIQKFEVEKAMLERDIQELKNINTTLFKKFDSLIEDVHEIKEVNAAGAVKLNNAERIFWIIVTGAIGALSIFTKGS